MELIITAVKQEVIWTFDHDFNNTKDEPLLNGTEKVLDWYFSVLNKGKQPLPNDKLIVKVRTEPYIFQTTRFDLIKTDDYGSTYKDEASAKKLWLCPWLQDYFGQVPEVLYVKIEQYEELDPEILAIIDEIVAEDYKYQ